MQKESFETFNVLIQNIDSEIEKIKKSYTKELIEKLNLESIIVYKSYSPFIKMGNYLTEELNKLLEIQNLENLFGKYFFKNFAQNNNISLKKIKLITVILKSKIDNFLDWSEKKELRIYVLGLDFFLNKHKPIFDNINLFKIDSESKISNIPFAYNEYNLNDDIHNIKIHYAEEILSYYSPIGKGRINKSELLTMFKETHRFTLYELLDIEENHYYFYKHYIKGLKLLIQFGILVFNKSDNNYELTVYGQHLINCTIHKNQDKTDFNPKNISIFPKRGKDFNFNINRLLAENFKIVNPEKAADYCSILDDFHSCCSPTEMKIAHKYASYKTGLPNLSTPLRKFRIRI